MIVNYFGSRITCSDVGDQSHHVNFDKLMDKYICYFESGVKKAIYIPAIIQLRVDARPVPLLSRVYSYSDLTTTSPNVTRRQNESSLLTKATTEVAENSG